MPKRYIRIHPLLQQQQRDMFILNNMRRIVEGGLLV
jgi:hypothetical protein